MNRRWWWSRKKTPKQNLPLEHDHNDTKVTSKSSVPLTRIYGNVIINYLLLYPTCDIDKNTASVYMHAWYCTVAKEMSYCPVVQVEASRIQTS